MSLQAMIWLTPSLSSVKDNVIRAVEAKPESYLSSKEVDQPLWTSPSSPSQPVLVSLNKNDTLCQLVDTELCAYFEDAKTLFETFLD